MYPQKITDFEQLATIPEAELKEALKDMDARSLATALAGASPQINALLEKLLPKLELATELTHIGRIRIEEVEDMQKQIVSLINLQRK